MDGRVIPVDQATCSALSPMHLGVFEGIRAYVQAKDLTSTGPLAIFRWNEHMNRLWRSSHVSGIEIAYTREQLLQGVKDAIKANKFNKNSYIGPRVWPKNYLIAGMTEKEVHVLLRVASLESILDEGNEKFAEKYRLNVSSWRRLASDALPPQNKSFANYANSRLAEIESQRLGFDDCLFLDSRGLVSESGGSCIFMVKNGAMITPPISASILDSITRESLITIAREDLGIKVEEKDLTRVELYGADEIFLCGTWMEVRAVSSIDDIEIGSQYPGPLTRKIAKHFGAVVSGNVQHRTPWLTPV
jgi:branched-chain amino acid aminotransferase